MLKITRKVEYALIALRHLQTNKDGQLSSAKEIAEAYGIPQELLAKILQRLARGNIIIAVKGAAGGYKLTTDPNTINMTKFFEIMEVPMVAACAVVLDVWAEVSGIELEGEEGA